MGYFVDREGGYPGTAIVTARLLEWFEREEVRRAVGKRLFFCQREAIETIIYLYEATNVGGDDGLGIGPTFEELYDLAEACVARRVREDERYGVWGVALSLGAAAAV